MTTIFMEHYYLLLATYFVAISAFVLTVAYIIRRRWPRGGPVRSLAVNSLALLFSTMYALWALECAFSYVFVQSDGFQFTLTSRRWFHRYWRPINTQGFRDHEPRWDRKLAFVVGDSFAAGHGVRDIDDRFSNRLGDRLGSEWTVATLAQCGWDTHSYAGVLESHQQTPEVVIISYFINDIQHAAADDCLGTRQSTPSPGGLLGYVVARSYLCNWIYWRLYRGDLGGSEFWSCLRGAYQDGTAWNAHLGELDALVDYAERTGAALGFVVWPNLIDVAGSEAITSKVVDHLRGKGVAVLDLQRHFRERDPRGLVVNSLDAHPNEATHAEVAELLHETMAPWK